jgi:hypothetical protein
MLNLPFLGFAQDSSDLASEALALQRMIHSGPAKRCRAGASPAALKLRFRPAAGAIAMPQ